MVANAAASAVDRSSGSVLGSGIVPTAAPTSRSTPSMVCAIDTSSATERRAWSLSSEAAALSPTASKVNEPIRSSAAIHPSTSSGCWARVIWQRRPLVSHPPRVIGTATSRSPTRAARLPQNRASPEVTFSQPRMDLLVGGTAATEGTTASPGASLRDPSSSGATTLVAQLPFRAASPSACTHSSNGCAVVSITSSTVDSRIVVSI